MHFQIYYVLMDLANFFMGLCPKAAILIKSANLKIVIFYVFFLSLFLLLNILDWQQTEWSKTPQFSKDSLTKCMITIV